jgi:hypothetical protein
MSHDHAWHPHNGRSTWIRNGLGIMLLIFIGSMILLIAHQILSHRGRSHTVKFERVLTSGDRTKLLPNIH